MKRSQHSFVGYDPSYLDLIHLSENSVSNKRYIAPLLGNILFGGNLVDVCSLYSCIVTTDSSFNDWKSIPDNLRVTLFLILFIYLVVVNLNDTAIIFCVLYEVNMLLYTQNIKYVCKK